MKTFGDYLRKRRFDLKLTKRDVAHKLGMHPSSIANWEKNGCIPKFESLACLRDLLGIVMNDLTDDFKHR
mgnify:CR=1 FL=1